MSDITWQSFDNEWHAIRGNFVRGRLHRDPTGAFWFSRYIELQSFVVELTGLKTIEEAQAAAQLLLSLEETKP